MKNIALRLQFDGKNYHGWQIQKNALTIQELIEDAVFKVTGKKASVTGCGRTDAGVSAKNFYCNFFTDSKIPPEKFPFAINAHLPSDVVCIGAEEKNEDFHASFSAVKKTYTYYVNNSPFPNVFKDSWHYPYKLDIEKMRTAARAFLGTHDFVGFASAGFSVKTTVRTIYSLDIEKDGDMIIISVTGDGFLYNMVRIITGTLLFVGSGKIDAADMEDIINSKDRTRAGITAPPDGLVLSEVFYEE